MKKNESSFFYFSLYPGGIKKIRKELLRKYEAVRK